MQADLAGIISQLDTPAFLFNGETYACIPSSVTEGKTLEIGGFEVEADKVLTVSAAAFTDGIYPEPLQKVTYMLKDYRIGKVVKNVNGAFLRLFLVDYVKGI